MQHSASLDSAENQSADEKCTYRCNAAELGERSFAAWAVASEEVDDDELILCPSLADGLLQVLQSKMGMTSCLTLAFASYSSGGRFLARSKRSCVHVSQHAELLRFAYEPNAAPASTTNCCNALQSKAN